jgi:hypothetical protein
MGFARNHRVYNSLGNFLDVAEAKCKCKSAF